MQYSPKTSFAVAMAAALLLGSCYSPPDQGQLPSNQPVPPSPPAGLSLRMAAGDLPAGRRSLRFALPPFLGENGINEQYAPLARHLTGALGVEVELVVTRSYGDLIDRAAADELDIVLLPPVSYVLGKERAPGLQLLAAQIVHGATTYSSYILVRADDPANSLGDLVGRRIAFVDERSTSGFVLPYAAFLDQGVDPRKDFSEVRFAGSHPQAIKDLAEGKVDAAATASGMLEMTRRGPRFESPVSDFRILHKAGRIPYDALCAGIGVPESGAMKIGWAFNQVSTRTAEGREVFAGAYGISGYMPVDDARYDEVRETVKRVREHRDAGEPSSPGGGG